MPGIDVSWVARAASAPARYEPSCSAKTMPVTFDALSGRLRNVHCVFGQLFAVDCSASDVENSRSITRSNPLVHACCRIAGPCETMSADWIR